MKISGLPIELENQARNERRLDREAAANFAAVLTDFVEGQTFRFLMI
jgi:hypothetical protein